MTKVKFNLKSIIYLILQIIFVLILCLFHKSAIISSSIVMLLLGIVLLMHSNTLISSYPWTRFSTYNFIIIILTIFFIPAYAAFRSNALIIVGIAIIIANLVAILLTFIHSISNGSTVKRSKIKIPVPHKKIVKKKLKVKSRSRILRKKPKFEQKIVAIKGGSKFHSLDCKMVENKSKKRLKYYYSAHDAQKDGLKPCKLCKAVSYLHQF